MNCKHSQKLLPLYIGRDLEEKRAQLVMLHMQSCAECAAAAEEYRETRQLLQQFAAPRFSEDVYADVRQSVLRQIRRESATPSLPQLVASLFRPRLKWAFATALLLAVSLFAFYFVANRRANLMNIPRQVAGSRQMIEDEQPRSGSESSTLPSPSSKQRRGLRRVIAPSGHRTNEFQPGKIPGTAASRSGSVDMNTSEPRAMTAEAALDVNNLAQPDAFPLRDPAASEKTLRVEMQTSDPNIRIIWFAQTGLSR